MTTPTLKLWRPTIINVFSLPATLRQLFPECSANEEDCIPLHEQETVAKQNHVIKAVSTQSDSPNVISLF